MFIIEWIKGLLCPKPSNYLEVLDNMISNNSKLFKKITIDGHKYYKRFLVLKKVYPKSSKRSIYIMIAKEFNDPLYKVKHNVETLKKAFSIGDD